MPRILKNLCMYTHTQSLYWRISRRRLLCTLQINNVCRINVDFLVVEPRRWSTADVAAWVQWARRQLQLPSVPLESFNVDGATLASLTEEEFCQRAPQVSVNIFCLKNFTSGDEIETYTHTHLVPKDFYNTR